MSESTVDKLILIVITVGTLVCLFEVARANSLQAFCICACMWLSGYVISAMTTEKHL